MQLSELERKQSDLHKELQQGYKPEPYKQLSIINYKIECLEARIAGKYEKDSPYILSLNELRQQ